LKGVEEEKTRSCGRKNIQTQFECVEIDGRQGEEEKKEYK
jgi:hypothetical protein